MSDRKVTEHICGGEPTPEGRAELDDFARWLELPKPRPEFRARRAASGIPRWIDMTRWTPAERAIYEAVQAVEAMGADLLLTDAVNLLAEARAKVAAFVDGAA